MGILGREAPGSGGVSEAMRRERLIEGAQFSQSRGVDVFVWLYVYIPVWLAKEDPPMLVENKGAGGKCNNIEEISIFN